MSVADPAPSEAFDPSTAKGGLTGTAISSGVWRGVSVFGGAALHFAVSIVLARLLPPSDFGILALVTVAIGVVNTAIVTGLGYPIVQLRELRPAHIETTWTLSLAGGLVCAAAVAATAPWLARLLGNPDSTYVFIGLSPLIFLSAARLSSLSLLRRQFRFRQLMVCELGSYAVGYGGVALAGALLGWGLWALVAGTLTQAVILAAGSYAFARHPVGLGVDRQALRELTGLGGAATASAVASFVALNGDNFVVGRFLGSTALGLYTRAYYLMNLPLTYFAQILSQVLLPAYSRVQNEPSRMARAYVLSVYAVFLVAMPAMMFLLLAAPHLITGLYGEAWVGVVKPLQVLALFGALRALYHLGGPLVQGSGRPRSELMRQIMYAVLVIVGAIVGSRWGVTGVAWGVGCAITVMYVAMAQLSHSVAHFRWTAYGTAHIAGAVAGAGMLAIGFVARHFLVRLQLPDLVIAACLGVLFVIVTLVPASLLPRRWRPEGAEQVLRSMIDRLPRPSRKLGLQLLRLGES